MARFADLKMMMLAMLIAIAGVICSDGNPGSDFVAENPEANPHRLRQIQTG